MRTIAAGMDGLPTVEVYTDAEMDVKYAHYKHKVNAAALRDEDVFPDDEDVVRFRELIWQALRDAPTRKDQYGQIGYHEYLHLRIPNMHPKQATFWQALGHAFKVGFDCRVASHWLALRFAPKAHIREYQQMVLAWIEAESQEL